MAISKINSKSIEDGIISADDLAAGSISTAKIADSAVTAAKVNDGDISTAKIADSAVTAAKITDGAVTNSKITGNVNFKNIVINGDMSIAQRSTSVASISNTSGYFTCDRWRFLTSGTGTWTQSQSTDVPSGQGFANSIKLDCTTSNTQSSADYLMLNYNIEGQNVQYLKKGTANAESLTLSFWTKSNKTGTYTFELDDNDNGRSISKTYTILSADTWEKKTITIEGDTTGTLDNDNNNSLRFYFWLGAGSDYTSGTLQTSWQSTTDANRVSSSNVYLGDSTNDEVYITGIQLEAGTTASDFEFLPHDVNLQRCQRYFWKTYEIGVAVGSSPDANSLLGRFVDATTSYGALQVPHLNLRATPTVTIYNPHNGTTGQLITDANVAKTAASESIGARGGGFIYANNASVTISASLRGHLTLSSEL